MFLYLLILIFYATNINCMDPKNVAVILPNTPERKDDGKQSGDGVKRLNAYKTQSGVEVLQSIHRNLDANQKLDTQHANQMRKLTEMHTTLDQKFSDVNNAIVLQDQNNKWRFKILLGCVVFGFCFDKVIQFFNLFKK